MMQRVLSFGFVFAALCVTACGSAPKKTVADLQAPLADVRLLDAGEQPVAPLRYAIPSGKMQRAQLDFRIASTATEDVSEAFGVLPGFQLVLSAGPAKLTESGFQYELRIRTAEAVAPEGTPEPLLSDVDRGIRALTGMRGILDIDNRGIVHAANVPWTPERSDVHPRLVVMLNNVRSALAIVPFPLEPVGVGARWEVRRRVSVWSARLEQVVTYTLVERSIDQVRLGVAFEQTSAPQTSSINPEVDIRLTKYQSVGSGEVRVRLGSPLSAAEAQMETVADFELQTDEETEAVQAKQRAVVRLQTLN